MMDPSLQRKTPLKRSTKPIARSKLKQRGRLKGTSIRQRPVGVIPLQTRAALKLRENETCQRCKRWTPNGDAHHFQLRSQGGSDDLDNLRWLCRNCHIEEVHRHPKRAKREGWIKPMGTKR